jgi:Fur family transcriptional regulator, ferric uptake regulator
MPIRNAPSVPPLADLKSSGLKATLPRLKILEVFQRSSAAQGIRHMSAEDVYKALIAEQIDVGLATVYRVLTQFEQAGLLTRHHFEAGRAVFELNEGAHHDHLVCLTCGRVEEFFDADIEARQQRVAAERGFTLHDHALALYGTCSKPNCPHRHTAEAHGA